MSDAAIQIEGLTRVFGTVRAVDNLSLEVPAGIIFGFLGPNGSGKTTTINLLLGLLEPTEGRADVLGFDTHRQAEDIRARTGALLDDHGLYEQLNAEDNLEFYARIWQLPAAKRQSRIKELLTHVGLWERRRDKVATWSRGMKQKLAIARALIHRPRLIFLDEPTAGLDVMAATEVRRDLAAIAQQEGMTVFLTTHNMVEAERLCGMVAVIRRGRLLTVGHPDELRARAGGPRVEIVGRGFGEALLAGLRQRPEVVAAEAHNSHLSIDLRADVEVAPLIDLAVAKGVRVEEVRRGKASLEEVFVTLMEEEK
ncbi:MAG: ABC transporter ATP-binding protein [Chloroflexota bacterium]